MVVVSGMREFGLIGKSLSHSFSRRLFEEKFAREGTGDAVYSLFEIADIRLFPDFLNERPDLLGLNVTIPYKRSVIPFLNELSEEAASVGAVNTILIQHIDGKVHTKGFNTDIIGFQRSLQGMAIPDSALILGTGGAAAAVTHVLERQGCRCAAVSRKAERGLAYPTLTTDDVAAHKLIVNCTPLGTWPKPDEKPDIPYDGISGSHLLYDLVYNPPETAFLKEGSLRGAKTRNGLAMLHAQAEAAWQIWNTP